MIRALILVTVLALTAGALEFPATRSPFRDKPVRSYSGGTNLTWGTAPLDDFGPRAIRFEAAGIRAVRQIPEPGIHPRILCTPADRDDIRRRLRETRCGQEAWKNLLSWSAALKGLYDDKADYAQPDRWKGGFGLHGRVPLYRLDAPQDKGRGYNMSTNAADLYRRLSSGTATNAPDFYWNVYALEAFRCWIEDDAAAAKMLAGAVITTMKLDQAKRAALGKQVPPDQPVGGLQLAFVYDFLFQWLEKPQREAIHAELADATWIHDNYGTFNEASSSRSNWASFSYWLFQVLAIEGETGFNDLKVRGIYRGWRNQLTYGYFPSGATFEGEAKNQLGMDGVLTFALREKAYGFQNLAAHPFLRAYATNFLPKSVLPTGDGFVTYDLLGGVHGRPMAPDSLGLKYLFPQDPVIDRVYRSAVGENYENVPDRCDGYRNDLLFFLIFATDFDPTNRAAESVGLAPTFFCGERALLMTRSGWDTNALMLNLHTRQANGGHAFADRNAILLAGAGRVWSPTTYASFQSLENGVVTFDGQTQDLDSPGRMVDFVDQPLATFAVGDAKHAWDWKWQTLGRTPPFTIADVRAGRVEVPPGWTPVEHSVNDFSFTKHAFAHLDRPLFEQTHWVAPAGALSPVVRQPNQPVRKAFRTAGIVRGAHPYALVVDDIQVDDKTHRYDWQLVLEKDIAIERQTRAGGQLDIVLKGTNSDARLLIRFLAGENLGDAVLEDFANCSDPKKYGPVHRLLVPSQSVAPDFKVFLYPFNPGAPQPVIERTKTGVSIAIAGQRDVITFAPLSAGKTDLTVAREGAATVRVDRPVPPLKDAALEREEARIAAIRARLAGFKPESLPGRIAFPPPGMATTNGKVGAAWAFNGAKDGVALPLDLKSAGSNGFTVAFWSRGTGSGTLIANNGNRGFSLGYEHGRTLRVDALGQHRWKGTTPLEIGTWHHMALTVGEGTVTVYLDGQPLKSDPLTPAIQLSPTTTLGAGLTGALDDLRLYARPLVPMEIERLHGFGAYIAPTP